MEVNKVDEEIMLVLNGQSMIMDMLLSLMPGSLNDSWVNDVSEHNQKIVDLFAKSGISIKESKKES
jgi:hypothetical protein